MSKKKSKNNGNNHKKSEIPEPNRRQVIGWGSATLGLLLTGGVVTTATYLLRGGREEEPPKQDRLDRIINADFIKETFITDDFLPLTTADKRTLDFLERCINKYYDHLDKRIASGEKISLENTDADLTGIVTNPLIKDIWKDNVGLREVFLRKFSGRLNFEGDELDQTLHEYFAKKGLDVTYSSAIGDFGIAHGMTVFKIEKEATLSGSIWGHPFKNRKLIYLVDQPIIKDYAERHYGQDQVAAGSCREGEIVIRPRIYKSSYQNLLKKLSTLDPDKPVKTIADLYYALVQKGAQEYKGHPELFQDFTQKAVDSAFFHEAAHTVFRDFFTQITLREADARVLIEQTGRDEAAAHFTELKNCNNNHVYLTLSTLWDNQKPTYKHAKQMVFDYFLRELAENRHQYPTLNYSEYDKSQKIGDLLPQIVNLNVNQIRRIAAKGFMHYFPQLSKL